MRVLIVVGSKHGSTSAIAAAVGEELRHGGLEVAVTDAGTDVSLDGYDAAVIGSAVYVGRWMKDARTFLEANRGRLRGMPLWLFSSGPLGDQAEQPTHVADLQAFVDDLQARDHRVFAGRLDQGELSLAERAAVRMVHAPYGDVRDWREIRSWAKSIAEDLTDSSGSAPASAVRTAPA